MPIGTLTQKIQCHDSVSVSTPPATGPSATPAPEIADQMPSAAPRRSAGKAAVIIVSVSGMITAPPMPSTARAAISVPAFGASAPAAEDSVNSATPAVKTRRRP